MPRALALQARGLTKAYRGVVAVESLDLEVETGTILGFLGPNGAGKTTVIRMLSTILRPDAGWFAVAGVPRTSRWRSAGESACSPRAPAIRQGRPATNG